MVKFQKTISVIIIPFFFACMALILLIELRTLFNYYDEGFAMFGPIRILNGDLPYKDFWAIYPPGQFYILAAIIKIFGPNLINARLYDTLIRLLMVIGLYLIVKRVASPSLALFSSGITTLLLASAGFYSYAVFPTMTLGIWSIWCFVNFTENGHDRWLMIAGFLLGIAAIIRWDIALYALISLLVSSYAFIFTHQLQVSEDLPSRSCIRLFIGPLVRMHKLLMPFLVLAGMTYVYFGLMSGWENLFDQVFFFPTVVLHNIRWLPYPTVIPRNYIFNEIWLSFYIPLIVFLITFIALIIKAYSRHPSLDKRFFTLLSLLLFGVLLFNQALSRNDKIHIIPASILIFPVVVVLFQLVTSTNRTRISFFTRGFLEVLLLGLLAFYVPNSFVTLLITLKNDAPWSCHSSLPILSCTVISADEEQAASYIKTQTLPGDRIFVGNRKHTSIFVNDIGFYYLSERLSVSRFNELYPGVATTLPVQRQIVDELEKNRVAWVVLVDITDPKEQNLSSNDSGVVILDEYIRNHYVENKMFGKYQVMKRFSEN
jgi:hypothetical protein